ncbi:MAG TPA: CsbD family protein [Polyangiaceae bacterium]|nr:CsbD family protein [Polyangiaceae bacterium]
MNWSQFEGQWHQVRGNVKSKWGRLSAEDLRNITGTKDVLLGKFQERYGAVKSDAQKQLDTWRVKAARADALAAREDKLNGGTSCPSSCS